MREVIKRTEPTVIVSTTTKLTTFYKALPTAEDRREVALKIIDPNADDPNLGHRSQYVLALHWGDDEKQLRAAAETIYDAQHDALAAPVSVMSITKSKAGEQIEVAVIKNAMIHHKLGGLVAGATTTRDGLKPPYARFSSNLHVRNRHNLEIGPILAATPRDGDRLPFYAGIISLSDDLTTYPVQRRVQSSQLIVGNDVVFERLQKLSRVSKDSAWAFDAVADQGILSPNKPLPAEPNLGELLSRRELGLFSILDEIDAVLPVE